MGAADGVAALAGVFDESRRTNEGQAKERPQTENDTNEPHHGSTLSAAFCSNKWDFMFRGFGRAIA
jgi:hypothetical protein